MIHDIINAEYKGDYLIELFFDDGKRGIVDFSKYLKRGGVFRKLKNLEYFRAFQINKELGVLTWADELDIAPETLYAEATGTRLPSWMGEQEKTKSTNRRPSSANALRMSNHR
jgi:hypothetical protein